MMGSATQERVELTAILNLVPYFDKNIFTKNNPGKVKLKDLASLYAPYVTESNKEAYKIFESAIDKNPAWGEIELVDQSSTNSSKAWTDDFIQACTFRKPNGDYYVTYRGTGDGRWPDNAEGMVKTTEMQKAAADYFDDMVQKHYLEDESAGKLFVTGHSKGGNEAQYTFMAAKYAHLIDNCYSLDGQGFSKETIEEFKSKYGSEEYEKRLSRMYSVNGYNDYVHDLGHVIIPDENTYFVGTAGDGFGDYHKLEAMVSNGDYIYSSLQWTDSATNKPYEQGLVGRMSKEISEEMMKLDKDDLLGASKALMVTIDAAFQGKLLNIPLGNFEEYIVGNADFEAGDFFDLVADGVPAVIEAVLGSKEGREALAEFFVQKIEAACDKYGTGAVVGTIFGAALAITVNQNLLISIAGSLTTFALTGNYFFDRLEDLERLTKKFKTQ